MIDFEAGKKYISKKGIEYEIIAKVNDCVTLQHLNRVRKSRIHKYCGVNAISLDFGEDMIFAESIKPIEDPTIEYGYKKQQQIISINNDGESYVSLFKRHQAH
jgi:hypothetical protein